MNTPASHLRARNLRTLAALYCFAKRATSAAE